MANYTTDNLLPTIPQNGVPAIRIGDQVFTMVTGGGGGGSATDFFKCATVTSGGSTWTGYKAVLSGGVYSFESAVTSGLVFDPLKKIPAVNGIYTADALVQVKYLYMGNSALLYMPLISAAGTAVTGQTIAYNGALDYETVSGIMCAVFQSDEYARVTVNSDATERSICMKMIIDDSSDWKTFLSYGTFAKRIAGNYDPDYYELYWNTGTWYSYILIFTGNELKEYLNGELKATRAYTDGIPNGLLQVGGTSFRGKICDVKVFPFALSDSQIADESSF